MGEEVEWREAKEEMPPYRLPLRLFGGLLAAQQEPAQDMERVVLIPCVEPLRHICLPASEALSVQTGLWLSFTPFLSSVYTAYWYYMNHSADDLATLLGQCN